MIQKYLNSPSLIAVLVLSITVAACSSIQQSTRQSDKQATNQQEQIVPLPKNLDRPVPNSIKPKIPHHFKQAVKNDTRTKSGKPGSDYWRQYSEYNLDIKIIPEKKFLKGSGTITYHNNSPDTLKKIYLEIVLNYKKAGTDDAVNIKYLTYNGQKLSAIERTGFYRNTSSKPGYYISQTNLVMLLPEPLLPGKTATLELKWSYNIPVFGGGGRMGYYNQDDFFYMAYWYPQIKVYDDVWGWHTVTFKPRTEFYHEFADYQIDISVPEQWIVNATGTLTNAQQLLQDDVYKRLQKAYSGTDIVRVVSPSDFGEVTVSADDGYLTWHYNAQQVNDFAFSVTKNTIWEATTTPVGDRDGDGTTDYSKINTIFNKEAKLWDEAARYAQHSIKFFSNYTGLSYPWPQMTAVQVGGMSGMEYPMMTLTGAFKGRKPGDLYRVIAHELAHMWVPMQLATNERRYAWLDEGTTNFNAAEAMKNYPLAPEDQPEIDNFRPYIKLAGSDREGPMMRRSQHFYMGGYGIASYYKPASVLIALRGLLGKDTFMKAYHTYMDRWQFKHPYPWDFFSTIEDVSGQNLDWFWRSWYYTTWVLDQAVSSVNETKQGARIVIRDKGNVPMPATVKVVLANGKKLTKHIDVNTWLHGAVETTLTINADADITKVVIDPEHKFPDANRANNVWEI